MSLSPLVAAVSGLVVVSALWFADHSLMVRDAALKDARDRSDQIDELTRYSDSLQQVVSDRAELQDRLTDISRASQQVLTVLDGQTVLINRNLSELKRNDKAIFDYLGSPVPVAIGLRYARPETTDPAAYRAAAAGVQPGAVPPAGASAAGSH